jgi:hypothetical protein
MARDAVIRHPGPPSPDRVWSVPCRAEPVTLKLAGGQLLLDAVAGAFAASGFRSGYLRLADLVLDPLAYVIPADAPDHTHAAWYSDTFRPEGPATVTEAGLFLGMREGTPFYHCHGLWQTAGGLRMGHALPGETWLAQDVAVSGWGVSGAIFDVVQDAETNFTLFTPTAFGPGIAQNATLAAVRPNEDLCDTLDRIAPGARVEGIGSLVGCMFDDGREVSPQPTEILITRATGSEVEIALVDRAGDIHRGWLRRGENPVFVTFELLILHR